MNFSLQTYHPDYLEGLTALYNAETAFEPHIAPLTPERFVELVEKKSYFDPKGLWIAVEGGQVVGWIHACVAPGSEAHHDPREKVPRLRMLLFPRDRLPVGRALVAEATAWLQRAGHHTIEALHAEKGYPFYRGLWLGSEPMAPMTLPHVQLVLRVSGYRITQESVFMVAEMASPPPRFRPGVDLEWVQAPAEMKHEPMRESWIGFEPMQTWALLDGEEVGRVAWVVLPQVADRLGAPALNIWGLGVREPYRCRGFATALVSHAMSEGYAQGARFASVGTQLWNLPAHATYAKLGFQPYRIVVGRTRTLHTEGTA